MKSVIRGTRGTRAVPDALRRKIISLVGTHGEREASARLGVCRNTVARCAAGLTVQPATLAVVEMRLARHESELAPDTAADGRIAR